MAVVLDPGIGITKTNAEDTDTKDTTSVASVERRDPGVRNCQLLETSFLRESEKENEIGVVELDSNRLSLLD